MGDSSSDSSVEDFDEHEPLLNETEKEKLIEEFAAVTATDASIARQYLQVRKWNVVRAVNNYFREDRKAYKRQLETELSAGHGTDNGTNVTHHPSDNNKKKKVTISMDDAQPGSSRYVNQSDAKQQRLFRHITWNIDGMNDKNIKIRIEAVCNTIIKEKATIVFLQEVTTGCEDILQKKLVNHFFILTSNVNSAPYYTLTLVAKQEFIKVESSEIVDFRNTIMARNILKTRISIDNVKLCLLNTHLESTKEGTAFRVQQLSHLLSHFKKIDSNATIIAGGDLNLRDKEITEIGGLPSEIVDAWVATGSRKEVQYTWDMLRNDNLSYYQPGAKKQFKPRMRFDRVFIRKTFPVQIEIVHFGLVGLERLKPNVCFPSDHWGVITSYQIFKV